MKAALIDFRRRRAATARALAPVLLLLALPDHTPQEAIYSLSMLLVTVCTAIFVVVAGLLAYGLWKYRERKESPLNEPPQVYGSNEIELAWTVIPILLVFIFFLATARTLNAVQNATPNSSTVNVTVVGHQWWWEIRYPELGITTANELHMPASDPNDRRPTFIRLESVDVAHSFWVPELGGKTDVIPNRVNSMWLEPRRPGVYLGNCAEFCGLQHANMLIRVVVDTPEDFEKWVAAERANAVTGQAQQGEALFLTTSCVNCHAVRGTRAAGTFGPDLTHLMSRQTIGSGMVQNTPEKLHEWMRDPQNLKPGCRMPNMQLTDSELDAMVAYLLTLK
jgi:cytochrome c oxidase subunit 2